MLKLFYIASEEVGLQLREWTFYLTALGMPLIFAAISLLPQLRAAIPAGGPLGPVETVFTAAEGVTRPTGYVDEAEMIQVVPAEQAKNLHAFGDEAAAAAALARGEIEQYYVIAADYRESGLVVAYRANPQLLNSTDEAIRNLLQDNTLHALNDPNLAARLNDPVQFEREGRPEPPIFNFIPANLKRETLASAMLVVGLFAYLINAGGYLLIRALKRETRARVLEVMMTSATPEQFIGGKLLGLSALALTQGALTFLVGMLGYGQTASEAGSSGLPPSTLALSLPYLLLGYLAYCANIMGIAAAWPNFSESGVLLAIARLLALSPLMGVVFILPDPNSLVSVLLTTLPLTAPLLMPFRLLLTSVPLWQWGLGMLGLGLWAGFSFWLSARLFRMHALLTGQVNNPKVLWQAIWP